MKTDAESSARLLIVRDPLLRARGFGESFLQPARQVCLLDTPQASAWLRLFVLPAGQDRWLALATVIVAYRADALAVEMEYDAALFSTEPCPDPLLYACRLGIERVWGGPEHFVRFATLHLAEHFSPAQRQN